MHTIIKTVCYSEASVYGGSNAVRNTVSGDYVMRFDFTIVGIARGTLSGDDERYGLHIVC